MSDIYLVTTQTSCESFALKCIDRIQIQKEVIYQSIPTLRAFHARIKNNIVKLVRLYLL